MDKKIFRLLTLGIMLTIFWFSNQDANVSDTQSGFFAMLLPFLPVWVIRKIAHMTLYAILAFCAACSHRVLKKSCFSVLVMHVPMNSISCSYPDAVVKFAMFVSIV